MMRVFICYFQTLNSIQSIVQQWPLADNMDNISVSNNASNGDCNANGPNSDSVHPTNNSDNSPNTTVDLSV